MNKTLVGVLLLSGLAGGALAQSTATPAAGDPTAHAVSPATGNARSTPQATPVPGTSTTGNAAAPGGAASNGIPSNEGVAASGGKGTDAPDARR